MDSSSESQSARMSCRLQWLSEAPPSSVFLKVQKLSLPCDLTVFLLGLTSDCLPNRALSNTSQVCCVPHTRTYTRSVWVSGCSLMPEEVSSSGTRVIVDCELSCGYWELNSSPLQKQQVLLTSDPSLPFCWIYLSLYEGVCCSKLLIWRILTEGPAAGGRSLVV